MIPNVEPPLLTSGRARNSPGMFYLWIFKMVMYGNGKMRMGLKVPNFLSELGLPGNPSLSKKH